MWKVTTGTLLIIILVIAFIVVGLLVSLASTPPGGWISGVLSFVQGIGKAIDFLTPG